MIEGLAQGWYHLKGQHVRLVFEEAAAGDQVSQGLLTWAGQELGETANAVIRQLEIQNDCFEVVLIGSVFKGGPPIVDPLQQTIRGFAPCASFTRLEAPPVAGGVLWGMELVGLHSRSLRQTLLDSISATVSSS
jgi:N-acetylglucosamine kinase-like BadF-type ATPase